MSTDAQNGTGDAMIKIGVKGLAKFMTASAAGQRKVLRDYKFPDDEGTAQAAYYREARHLVTEFHRHGHTATWLREKAAVLQTTASALGGHIATRLRHNSRGLLDYASQFPSKVYDILPERKFYVTFGEVRVSILPDLHVREKQKERFLKLEFSKDPPDDATVKIVSQIMFEAAVAAKIPITSSDIVYVDVARGSSHTGARVGSRMKTEIEAACANITAMWDSIKRSTLTSAICVARRLHGSVQI